MLEHPAYRSQKMLLPFQNGDGQMIRDFQHHYGGMYQYNVPNTGVPAGLNGTVHHYPHNVPCDTEKFSAMFNGGDIDSSNRVDGHYLANSVNLNESPYAYIPNMKGEYE